MLEKLSQSFWMVLTIILLELLVGLLLFSSDSVREKTATEGQWIRECYGNDTALMIRDRADHWYEKVVLEPQLEQVLRDYFIPSEKQRQASRGLENLGSGMWPWIDERIIAFTDLLYWLFRRVHLFLMWVPACLPAFVIAVISGWYDRKIKQTNFQYASPALHLYAWRAVGTLIGMTILSFLVPVAVWPEIYPVVIISVMLLVGMSMGNIVKRI